MWDLACEEGAKAALGLALIMVWWGWMSPPWDGPVLDLCAMVLLVAAVVLALPGRGAR